MKRRTSKQPGRGKVVFLFNVDNTLAAYPAADINIERIGDRLNYDHKALLTAAAMGRAI